MELSNIIFNRNALIFGIGMESLMFSIALGDRINSMREENLHLVKNQNQILERKVEEKQENLSKIFQSAWK